MSRPFLGPKSFMIHFTSSGKVSASSLCKGSIAQRGEVISPALHSGQEIWGRDPISAQTPKPRLNSKASCAHPGLNLERHHSRFANRIWVHVHVSCLASLNLFLHLQIRITKGAPSLCGYCDKELRTQPRHKESIAVGVSSEAICPPCQTPHPLANTVSQSNCWPSSAQGLTEPRPLPHFSVPRQTCH